VSNSSANQEHGPSDPKRAPGDLYWDPFDKSLRVDPHSIWRRLRDEAPAYYNERYDFWALSRFADVDSAHRDSKTFSSAHGTVLELMTQNLIRSDGMMIFLDPPEHTQLRRLISKAFTPRRIATLEESVRQLCGELLDARRGEDSWDFVEQFGAILPATVIATLLGVPATDREQVRGMIDQMFHIEPGVGMINDVSIVAMAGLHEYIGDLAEDRRVHPKDDMLTDLVEAEIVDGAGVPRTLTHLESVGFAVLLVSAGTETVARLIGWAGLLLGTHPDQRAELVADGSLIPNAIEELLRYESPSPVQGRWSTADVELHGQVIPADSKVLLLTGSAGRDDRAFPDADRFDIHRQMDRHVSFGYGIHLCLGAALARMEGRIAVEETLKRYPTWEVDREHAVLLFTSTVRGFSQLPILV
jgi:cytochrome P450